MIMNIKLLFALLVVSLCGIAHGCRGDEEVSFLFIDIFPE